MIDSLTIPWSQFDLAGFISAYQDFHRDWSGRDSVAYFIVGMKRYDSIPGNFLDDDDPDPSSSIAEHLHDGLKVFFMMHEPPADDQFLSVDGQKRNSEDLDIGLEDGYGFLVELDDQIIHLHPALYDGSDAPPSITLQGACCILEEPMMSFVQRFVRG